MSATWEVEDFSSKYEHNLTKSVQGSKICLKTRFFYKCTLCGSPYQNPVNCCAGQITKLVYNFAVDIVNESGGLRDREGILFNEEFSDFAIIFDDEKVPVNKGILAGRSRKFFALFTTEWKGKSEYVMEHNFKKNAFAQVVRYIYTDEILDLENNVIDIMDIAAYYEIDSLKLLCDGALLKVLTHENAQSIFMKAHKFGYSDDLKRAAFEIIKEILYENNYLLKDDLIDKPKKVFTICQCIINLQKMLQEED